MKIWPFNKITRLLTHWLTKDVSSHDKNELPASDINRIYYEIRPCDVILVEGRSRVSEVIKLATKSNWSHAALYIGRFHDIKDNKLRKKVLDHYRGDLNEYLLIEGILGKGTIVTPLSSYRNDHIRICRPSALNMNDAERVMHYAISHLGGSYDLRHIADLLRLLFPIVFMPRYLFSSIFKPFTREPKKQICSSLLARAFGSVGYPILPKIFKDKESRIRFIPRNPKLFTPKDFDYSPYFNIVKYPFYGLDTFASYHNIPWVTDGSFSNDGAGIIKLGLPHHEDISKEIIERAEKIKKDTDEKKA